MTIPLDKLYYFLDNIVNDDLVIYRWHPHGSKLLSDLKRFKNYSTFTALTNPIVVCHDQEPLNYFQYSEHEIITCLINQKKDRVAVDFIKNQIKLKLLSDYIQELTSNIFNVYDDYILLHSEQNSSEIKNYVDHGAVPVYYFSHALISRDWFRFAEVDPLISKKNIQKDFLIYQRAWKGTREYRLKFTEYLITSGLSTACLSRFSSTDDNLHYTDHTFKNNDFNLQLDDIENYFPPNDTPSCASADYHVSDYNQTMFEVVLETMFDDDRWHLTEKIFRPIACGQPFILVSTPGSLKYLKSYGFKTFDKYIDESYDQITDPVVRLQSVINTMKCISSLSPEKKIKLSAEIQEIADFNRQLFFSKSFYKKVVDEYLINMQNGLEKLKLKKGKCLDRWERSKKAKHPQLLTDQEYQDLLRKI